MVAALSQVFDSRCAGFRFSESVGPCAVRSQWIDMFFIISPNRRRNFVIIWLSENHVSDYVFGGVERAHVWVCASVRACVRVWDQRTHSHRRRNSIVYLAICDLGVLERTHTHSHLSKSILSKESKCQPAKFVRFDVPIWRFDPTLKNK